VKITKYETEEAKKEISSIIKKHTKRDVEPIERRVYNTDLSSFVCLYKGIELEIFSFTDDKNVLFNRVLSEFYNGKILDKTLKKL